MSETMMRPSQGRGQRSPVRGKDTVTILREVMRQQLGNPQEVEEFINNIAKLCSAKSAKPIQIGNTVFLALHTDFRGQPLPQGVAEIHLFSAEPFNQTAKRMMVLPNTLRELGYSKFTTYVTDTAMSNLMQLMQKKLGLQASFKQDVQMIDDEMTPVIRVEVQL